MVATLLAGCGGDADPTQASLGSGGSSAQVWAGYHWPRNANPVAVRFASSVTGVEWQGALDRVMRDWQAAPAIAAVMGPGAGAAECPPVAGRIEVCNDHYGATGWLGLATVWVVGNHIVQATVKLNETYFAQAAFDDSNVRRHVLCQETGHALGLDHRRDEVTCMNDRQGLHDPTYASPGGRDYDELARLYGHSDPSTTAEASVRSFPFLVP